MAKDEMNKLDQLAEKIEIAFDSLQSLMKQINEISNIADTLETTSKRINQKYLEILDQRKFDALKDSTAKALDEILKNVKKVEDAMLSIDVLKQQTVEAVNALTKRIGTYEDNLRISKETAREIDDKLIKILKSAENSQSTGEKRILTASKLLEASAEVEKYDQLLKLTNENHRLLQQVLNKISNQSRSEFKPVNKNGQNNNQEAFKTPFGTQK